MTLNRRIFLAQNRINSEREFLIDQLGLEGQKLIPYKKSHNLSLKMTINMITRSHRML